MASEFNKLLADARACRLCKDLPLGPNPILQGSPQSKILICGQAPGRITHHKNIPFDDPSGVRLRDWLGVSWDEFYDPDKIAIIPMGFCFPGTGKGGDLPPPPICAQTWRQRLLDSLTQVELTLIIGKYAIDWHLEPNRKLNVTDRVRAWRDHWPEKLVTPHPSPRNNRWLKTNPWFEGEIIPELQTRVRGLLG
ncbi:MAG: uracil-DNA glycosylase family protein [Maricaulaceae bacterium]